MRIGQILIYKAPWFVSPTLNLLTAFSGYSEFVERTKFIVSLDLVKDLTVLPSYLKGTMYSGSVLVKQLAANYVEGEKKLDEIFGRTELSLQSLGKADSILEELGIQDSSATDNQEIYCKFQKMELNPTKIADNFEKGFHDLLCTN